MKPNNFFAFSFLAVLALSLTGCLKDKCESRVTYTRVETIYKTLDEIHAGTAVFEAPRSLENTGGINYYNNKIYINERSKGIHIIDNSNPANPVNLNFIAIPGNESFAIKNGILYANSYVDLLAIDLSTNLVVGRTESVFPPLWEDLANNRLAVAFEETQVTEEVECGRYNNFYRHNGEFIDFVNVGVLTSDAMAEQFGNNKADGTGIGGSMSRFTIVGDYLYVVDNTNLDVFSLVNPTQPAEASTVNIGWGIETIFPYGDKLFIGSSSGMFIFDNSNPTAPSLLSEFQHASACDPVFVKDNYAYVTLRSGNACQGFTDQLELIDITNLSSPFLVKSFPMQNPHGLTISGNNLFLCEGDFGLKSFDITDPTTLDQRLLDKETGLHAFDAISLSATQNLLMVIGDDGLYQFNFDNPADLQLLSKISTK